MGAVDWAKAARHSAIDALIPQPFVFHHIPKCGGTSVGRALRRRYLLSQATISPEASYRAFELFSGRNDRERMLVDVLDLREQMLMCLMFEDIRGISVHVRFSQKAHERFAGRYKFITVLRHPVERFISHYYWDRSRADGHAAVEEDIEAFLETDRARRYGATLVEYLCGLPKEVPTDSDEAVASGIANLAKLDVVGDIADVATLETSLRDTLGVKVSIGHENRRRPAGARSSRASDDAAVRSRIEAICAPDMAVYSHFLAGRR